MKTSRNRHCGFRILRFERKKFYENVFHVNKYGDSEVQPKKLKF